jgi:hypothetical protein
MHRASLFIPATGLPFSSLRSSSSLLSFLLFTLLLSFAAIPGAHAELALDSIQFDPAIIASGDRVDIVVQFHDTGLPITQQYLGDPSYQFKVSLEQDDTLSRTYTLIEDVEGKDLQGIISRGGQYNKRFRVKVMDNAPPGAYGFTITGRWYKDGVPTDSEQYIRFTMPVKKEGIALSVANVMSAPERIRSGDKAVLLTTSFMNSGEKTAKNVRISLSYPDGITSSYTNDNTLTVGTIEAGAERPVQFFIDTDRTIKEGRYDITYALTYQDQENNDYRLIDTFPIIVKKKPDIVVIETTGQGRAGEDIALKVVVQNRGEETADAVDVRILTQSSQPFEMDVRSDYLGQLVPGENGTAIFTIHADKAAEAKDHKLSVIIRAKGDSEEGDDNIYTFTDAATLRVTGPPANRYPLYAGIFFAIIVIGIIARVMLRKKTGKR